MQLFYTNHKGAMALMRDKARTKRKIEEAAIILFNAKGYHGTSVRDIAQKAKVNVANISYYFRHKQGLLEALITSYFERYLAILEEEVRQLTHTPPIECFKRAVKEILLFHQENYLLTRLVMRELTVDSQVVREIIGTYMMKERFLFKQLVEPVFSTHHRAPMLTSMIIIQLKGMLTTPFLNSQYLREVWYMLPQEGHFVDTYYHFIVQWINGWKQSPSNDRGFVPMTMTL